MKTTLFILLFSNILYASQQENIKENYIKSYHYEQITNYNEAIKVLTPLYLKYPKNYTLNLRFAWLFFLNKKYQNSIAHYNKSLLTKPRAITPKLGLIENYLNLELYKKAEALAYSILKKDYYNYYANLYLIKILIHNKKHNIATNVIHKMLALYPTDIKYLEQLFIVYKHSKNPNLPQVKKDILILDPNNILIKSLNH